ncbi:3-dehydroquinate synthase [Sphingomonas quercus]|uniref:3-dehydroquinate synthase n=1 Tax=Sphingomonas quercus TaxID=2842451 RepID=A0ABS6BMW8_9SPHN|nr:3-dehydroquinate synthase [Sphingomonas quercus]MBU3078982.1 3-dehydroquinate synthase [Sphingomonas quercus]
MSLDHDSDQVHPTDEMGAPPAEAATDIYVQRFTVAYDYPVAFTRDLFAATNPVFVRAVTRQDPDKLARIMVLVDEGVAAALPGLTEAVAAYVAAHADRLELVAAPEVIPGGEGCKNDPALVERLQRRVVALGVDRHSVIVAIGGGAVLDLVGYVAATVHRGIRHVRVPTTVLGQNDSGVGVKNGVNAFGQKNLLGSFAPPFAVLNDAAFLDRLDPREKTAGMAEAVKVALIRDGAFFAWLEAEAAALRAHRRAALDRLVRRCAELHMIQIAGGGDPFERGSARPLDYGHWSAHKLELLTDHGLRHGEAVAIGLALDARYSVLAGHLAAGGEERVHALLTALGLPVWHPMLEAPELLRGLGEFREHLGGELTITLLAGIGRGIEVHEMDETLIRDAIAWLKARAA